MNEIDHAFLRRVANAYGRRAEPELAADVIELEADITDADLREIDAQQDALHTRLTLRNTADR